MIVRYHDRNLIACHCLHVAVRNLIVKFDEVQGEKNQVHALQKFQALFIFERPVFTKKNPIRLYFQRVVKIGIVIMSIIEVSKKYSYVNILVMYQTFEYPLSLLCVILLTFSSKNMLLHL